MSSKVPQKTESEAFMTEAPVRHSPKTSSFQRSAAASKTECKMRFADVRPFSTNCPAGQQDSIASCGDDADGDAAVQLDNIRIPW